MLALRTMAGDVLKDDVNDATSYFRGFYMTFNMIVGLYDGTQHHVTAELAIKHFTSSFVEPRHI